jgi:hypothetical protein
LLAIIATSVYSQGDITVEHGQRGYWYEAEASVPNGWFYVSYEVTQADMNPEVNATTLLWIRAASADSYMVQGHAVCYIAKGIKPKPHNPGQVGVELLVKNNNEAVEESEIVLHEGPGTYIVGCIINNCDQCNDNTGHIQMSSLIRHRAKFMPFKIQLDPYTLNYTQAIIIQSTYGPSGYLDLLTDDDVYVKVTIYNPLNQVVMVYTKDAPPGLALPATDSPTTKRFPKAEALITGSYSTGPVALTAGRWYITPYSVLSQNGKVRDFIWAVGVGKEPAGAGSISPSIAVLATLAAVYAALRQL